MMMLSGKKEEGQRKEGNKLFPWEIRTSGPQLGRKRQATEIAYLVSPVTRFLACSRNPTTPMLLCRSLPPGHWVQTKLGKDAHNPQGTCTLRTMIRILLGLWRKCLTYLYKTLPKHCGQSHFILTMRNHQPGFLLMRKPFVEGKHAREVCRGQDENSLGFVHHPCVHPCTTARRWFKPHLHREYTLTFSLWCSQSFLNA